MENRTALAAFAHRLLLLALLGFTTQAFTAGAWRQLAVVIGASSAWVGILAYLLDIIVRAAKHGVKVEGQE
ncbi:MAG: hypothetical protein KDA37_18285 [Planctomycetales bacterium]|nr:hypothetical protein [Planctomycetales bacterium]